MRVDYKINSDLFPPPQPPIPSSSISATLPPSTLLSMPQCMDVSTGHAWYLILILKTPHLPPQSRSHTPMDWPHPNFIFPPCPPLASCLGLACGGVVAPSQPHMQREASQCSHPSLTWEGRLTKAPLTQITLSLSILGPFITSGLFSSLLFIVPLCLTFT